MRILWTAVPKLCSFNGTVPVSIGTVRMQAFSRPGLLEAWFSRQRPGDGGDVYMTMLCYIGKSHS
jgi:hypothetical protein